MLKWFSFCLTLLLSTPAAAALRMDFPNAWYAYACVNGERVTLITDVRVDTDRGAVPLPNGQNTLYLSHACDGSGRFAAVGGRDDGAWEWTGAWTQHGLAFGPNAVIYDAGKNLQIVWGPGTPTGSQGWRYVDDFGRLVTGDESYADPARHLWERTCRGNICCGQGGDEEGLQCLVNGRRVLVEPGIIRFIRFNREGDRVALAWVRQDTRSAGMLWLTVPEFDAYSTYTLPGEPPRPVEICGNGIDDDGDGSIDEGCPVPEPEPQPVRLADNIFATLQAVRKRYGPTVSDEEIGAILNEVAWVHRTAGAGLQRKDAGTSSPQPRTGIRVWRGLRVGNVGYDVCGACTVNVFNPVQADGGPADAASFVAPVEPIGTTPDPQPSNLEQRVAALEAGLRAQGSQLEAHSSELATRRAVDIDLGARVVTLERKPDAGGVNEERVRALILDYFARAAVTGSTARGLGHTHGVNLGVTIRPQ